MNIELTEDWRINVIPLNFVLEERVPKGIAPGEKIAREGFNWVVRGYYSGLRAALLALPDFLAQSPGVETLEGYLARWDKVTAQLVRRAGK